ncbi:MAG: hypothetical protein BLITH_0454 [Brockia lithotrophica]|uniref:Regulatory protein YycH-like domain-containing protein n=1 Tax=Brockia lithotrophica TaxID=933949 RepID=A0A2T5GB08_9BACL|nr:hypothetical protein [Brockia lithotrophica]PTQ53374.1 MAG: hypothetical protein BLITH_0454 [Brockia lithotrophica]
MREAKPLFYLLLLFLLLDAFLVVLWFGERFVYEGFHPLIPGDTRNTGLPAGIGRDQPYLSYWTVDETYANLALPEVRLVAEGRGAWTAVLPAPLPEGREEAALAEYFPYARGFRLVGKASGRAVYRQLLDGYPVFDGWAEVEDDRRTVHLHPVVPRDKGPPRLLIPPESVAQVLADAGVLPPGKKIDRLEAGFRLVPYGEKETLRLIVPVWRATVGDQVYDVSGFLGLLLQPGAPPSRP